MDAWMHRWKDEGMDGATDAWVDGGTLPRRPPVGRRRQRGFHGVHGAHQRVWAGSSEAAAGTAGRRHRLSLGLREAVERRVRGGRPRRGRGGEGGGAARRLRDPPSLRGRDLASGPWLARGAGRHAPPPLRAAPRAGHRGVRPRRGGGRRGLPSRLRAGEPRGLPGERTRPPARHCTPLPGVFPAGPGSGGPRGHRRFRFLRRRGTAAETGSPRGKTRKGGTPPLSLPRLPGAATTEPPAPGAPRRR